MNILIGIILLALIPFAISFWLWFCVDYLYYSWSEYITTPLFIVGTIAIIVLLGLAAIGSFTNVGGV